MIEFNLNNKDYNIKEFLSINDYQKIFKVKDFFEDDYMKARIIHLVTGCPMDKLINAENHQIEFLSTTIMSLIPLPPYNLVDRFEIDGISYGYLPSYKEITFGEFVDLDTLLTKKPDEVMDYLHIMD
jgi:hypothetical protein